MPQSEDDLGYLMDGMMRFNRLRREKAAEQAGWVVTGTAYVTDVFGTTAYKTYRPPETAGTPKDQSAEKIAHLEAEVRQLHRELWWTRVVMAGDEHMPQDWDQDFDFSQN